MKVALTHVEKGVRVRALWYYGIDLCSCAAFLFVMIRLLDWLLCAGQFASVRSQQQQRHILIFLRLSQHFLDNLARVLPTAHHQLNFFLEFVDLVFSPGNGSWRLYLGFPNRSDSEDFFKLKIPLR